MSVTKPDQTLVERDGRLFVQTSEPSYLEPKRITNYWPVDMGRSVRPRALLGKRLADPRYVGCFGLDPAGDYSEWHRLDGALVVLTHNGRTETIPSMREEAPIPAPKTRGKPVRWNEGRWEKLLAKGWTPA